MMIVSLCWLLCLAPAISGLWKIVGNRQWQRNVCTISFRRTVRPTSLSHRSMRADHNISFSSRYRGSHTGAFRRPGLRIYADHTAKMSVVPSGLLNTHFDIGKRAQKSSDRREILFIDVLSVEECTVDIWGNFLFNFIDISLHIIAESFKKFEQID